MLMQSNPEILSEDLGSAFEAIARLRRSVYFFQDRPVARHLLEQALQLAVLAPNHHQTRPWRFIVHAGAGRNALADAYAAAARRTGCDPVRARHRAFDAPVAIVIGCVPVASRGRIRPLEEEFATAAATQNLMLALTAMGLGSALNSGPLQVAPEVQDAAGLAAGRVVAVLNVGYRDPARELFRRPEPSTEGVVSWR